MVLLSLLAFEFEIVFNSHIKAFIPICFRLMKKSNYCINLLSSSILHITLCYCKVYVHKNIVRSSFFSCISTLMYTVLLNMHLKILNLSVSMAYILLHQRHFHIIVKSLNITIYLQIQLFIYRFTENKSSKFI